MFYTYILRILSQPEQRYIGSTADFQVSLAVRRFFLPWQKQAECNGAGTGLYSEYPSAMLNQLWQWLFLFVFIYFYSYFDLLS